MPRIGTGPICVSLLVLTLVAYAPLRHNDFVEFDDQSYITANEHVLQGFTPDSFAWAWTTVHGNYWQPLSWLSLQCDAHWFSTNGPGATPIPSALAVHFQNLFWHLASVVLLFLLLCRLTSAIGPSFLVAALFALHPLRVESVAWAAERKDVLSVFFGIVALHAYVWYCARPSWRRYVAFAAAFAASLMCKPMLMTLPAVLLLLDVWPLRRFAFVRVSPGSECSPIASWRLVLEKLPLVMLAAAIGVLTVMVREHGAVPLEVLPFSLRLANAPAAYAWYVTHTFYPLGLGVLYPHPGRDWSLASVLLGTSLLAGIAGVTVWQVRQRPWLLVGWLWFVGALVPVIGLSQGGRQAWADRFVYWPHIGLLIAIVWGLMEMVERGRVPIWARASLSAAALAGCGILTWLQVGHWQNTGTLWAQAIAVTEDNHRAHLNLGKWHLDRGEIELAAPRLAEAVRLRPDSSKYQYSFGLAQLLLGRIDVAAERFQQALADDAANVDAWHNLGMARLYQGKPAMAVPCFRRVLELAPNQSDARTELGRALWRSGQRAEAIQCFHDSLASNPADPYAWEGMGLAHLLRGDHYHAVHALSKALGLSPANQYACSAMGIACGRQHQWLDAARYHAQAMRMQIALEERLARMNGCVPEPEGVAPSIVFECRLAFALDALGDRRAAAAAYQAASERDPDWPQKLAAQAWRLATDAAVRDPQLSHETALQAIEGAHGKPSAPLLDALAASQAAIGDFPEAVRSARQALAVADAAIAESIRDHLEHYERGEPVTVHSD
jgi:protein O-mannosyl-transferase